MASMISWQDQYLWVANRQLSVLIDLVLRIGDEYAQAPAETEYVTRLRHWLDHEAWPGIGFDLDGHFSTVAEKKFWACCFFDLARRIFRREIAENEDGNTVWQASTIGDAYIIARMLTCAVQQVEPWYPQTEDSREAAERDARIRAKF